MRVIAIATLCVALGGCASVSRGTSETISVATTPSGAEATISGLDQPTVCTTPCAFTAARSADIVVSIAKEGYEPQIIPLTKELSGSGSAGFAGNLLLGGVIGMRVDAATGGGNGPQAQSGDRYLTADCPTSAAAVGSSPET